LEEADALLFGRVTYQMKNMVIMGSSALTVSLIGMGLVDEVRVMVCPVVLGDGKSLPTGNMIGEPGSRTRYQATTSGVFPRRHLLPEGLGRAPGAADAYSVHPPLVSTPGSSTGITPAPWRLRRLARADRRHE
jgi:hypothetical protein